MNEIGQHTSRQYNQELEEVRNKMLQMGGMVETRLYKALKSLFDHDSSLAKDIAYTDDEVNQMEVSIDEQCSLIIARRQPTASDLRLVLTIIKSTTDLERIGDEAEKIARQAIKSAELKSHLDTSLRHLSEHVKEMLRESLDAMVRFDSNQALRIARSDNLIDREFDHLSRELLTYMMEDPRNIRDSLNVMWCARSLERIGDHCQNLCEYVIYLVEGKDVRHLSLEGHAIAAEIPDR